MQNFNILASFCSWADSLFLKPQTGLENSTHPHVFTSASGCRASENFDISSENQFFPIYGNNNCDAGQVPILRFFETCQRQVSSPWGPYIRYKIVCLYNISITLASFPRLICIIPSFIFIFSYTFELTQQNTDSIWRFMRCNFIIEYCKRPPVAAPFICFFHLYLFLRYSLCQKCCRLQPKRLQTIRKSRCCIVKIVVLFIITLIWQLSRTLLFCIFSLLR